MTIKEFREEAYQQLAKAVHRLDRLRCSQHPDAESKTNLCFSQLCDLLKIVNLTDNL